MRKSACAVLVLVCTVLLAGMLAGCGDGGKPTINSISPSGGPPKTQLLIYGSGFGERGGKARVEFNGKAIGIKSWSNKEIVAVVPNGTLPGAYRVTVVNGKESSELIDFEVRSDTSSTRPPEGMAKKDLIVEYATANNIFHPGENFKEYATENIAIYTASKSDPTWELWMMPTGEGTDIDFFLLHREGDQWKVVKGGFYNNETPQQYGAPADITIPPSQE